MFKPNILLTTIPSDSHNWNLVYMQLLLEENGFEVTNLGPCTPFDEVEKQCYSLMPQFVIVSTVNGHGYIEGKELITRLRAIPHMTDTGIYIGGKLSTDFDTSCFYAAELEMTGFTKAYYENINPINFVAELKLQLVEQEKEQEFTKSLNA